MNVTVERIAELADDYMEVETVVADGADRGAARAVISAIFDAVGFGVNDLDPTCHIDLVRAARAAAVRQP